MPKAATQSLTKTTKSKLPSTTKSSAKSTSKDTKTTGKTKVPRGKKEKDPNAPKGAKSPYIIFCQDNREEAKKEAENTREIMRILADMWKNLSEQDKEPYKAKSQKDKTRFEREMKAYKGKENRSEDTD
ncbi:HMG-box [Dacryopinax primogenitus]|uniref:HMG-box n=1 Tax=Dacryopinax primogenitus (strain DJM 731) TaxID=1858805 RepID=M5FVR2_DACPD|nr:HMG-box [Dacryopinax primogenitus]EJU01921.1 HMG-box [Dacryopinax primogenitus]